MTDIRNKLIVGGLFGVGVIIALLLYTDLQEVSAHLSAFPLALMIPVLLLTLLNYGLRWFKWHRYLHLIGISDLPVVDSAALFVSGFVLALSPGKVAELLKAAVLRAMTGTPFARSAPVIVAERVTDGLAMLILAAIGFGGAVVQSSAQRALLTPYLPAYLAILGILITGIILIQFRSLFLRILSLVERIPLIGRISHAFHDMYESSYELFRPLPLTWAVALGVVSWAGECVAFYLILVGLGLPPGWLLLWQAMFILAASSIIGAVSGLPGGLGAAEFTIVGMVQLLILRETNPGLAGTAAMLVRLSTLWFGATLGLMTAAVFRKRLFPSRVVQFWQTAQSQGLRDSAA